MRKKKNGWLLATSSRETHQHQQPRSPRRGLLKRQDESVGRGHPGRLYIQIPGHCSHRVSFAGPPKWLERERAREAQGEIAVYREASAAAAHIHMPATCIRVQSERERNAIDPRAHRRSTTAPSWAQRHAVPSLISSRLTSTSHVAGIHLPASRRRLTWRASSVAGH